jgi:gamma-glutamylcyclotransferase (GGCT)/AIG2-like uncharacterized protein YtfP
MIKPVLYFAYGSNLNRRDMARRCPGAEVVGPARLDGYKLMFSGYINIIPARGETVWGGLYRLTPACLRALDKYEDAPRWYRHETVSVIHDGERQDALAYVMTAPKAAPPDIAHYNAILRGYADWKLDAAPLQRARYALLNGR